MKRVIFLFLLLVVYFSQSWNLYNQELIFEKKIILDSISSMYGKDILLFNNELYICGTFYPLKSDEPLSSFLMCLNKSFEIKWSRLINLKNPLIAQKLKLSFSNDILLYAYYVLYWNQNIFSGFSPFISIFDSNSFNTYSYFTDSTGLEYLPKLFYSDIFLDSNNYMLITTHLKKTDTLDLLIFDNYGKFNKIIRIDTCLTSQHSFDVKHIVSNGFDIFLNGIEKTPDNTVPNSGYPLLIKLDSNYHKIDKILFKDNLNNEQSYGFKFNNNGKIVMLNRLSYPQDTTEKKNIIRLVDNDLKLEKELIYGKSKKDLMFDFIINKNNEIIAYGKITEDTSQFFRICKFNANLELVWEKTWGDSNSKYKTLTNGFADNNGNIYLTGRNDKYLYISLIKDLTLDINELSYINNLIVSPNPAKYYINISIPPLQVTNWVADELLVRIYDVDGREVNACLHVSGTPSNPLFLEGNKLRIDVSNLTPGLYFVRVGERVGKFVKY